MADPSPEEALAERLRSFAESELAEYSPIYERIATALAEDPSRLSKVAPLAPPARLPGLLLAAVHDQVLADPTGPLAEVYGGSGGDPWPPFARLLDDRFADVALTVGRKTVQTNEVGRCTGLLPALHVVASGAAGRPLAIVEIGPSAGLNLLFDRYRYTYRDVQGREIASWGDPSSEVDLSTTVLGVPPPVPRGSMPVAQRLGIEVAPVDVSDERATRWLQACLWPDLPLRSERLRAALEVARSDPPAIIAADARTALRPLLDDLPGDLVPCVVSTWSLVYLPRPDRAALHAVVADLAAERDLALITAEYPHVTPWLPRPQRQADLDVVRAVEGRSRPPGATLLGLETWTDGRSKAEPLAWMQAHGAWIDWLATPGDRA